VFEVTTPQGLGAGGFYDAAQVDVDHDGDLDIIGSRFGTNDKDVSWILREPDGVFEWEDQTLATGLPYPHSVNAADFDQDGNVDVVYCPGNGAPPKVLWGVPQNQTLLTGYDTGHIAADTPGAMVAGLHLQVVGDDLDEDEVSWAVQGDDRFVLDSTGASARVVAPHGVNASGNTSFADIIVSASHAGHTADVPVRIYIATAPSSTLAVEPQGTTPGNSSNYSAGAFRSRHPACARSLLPQCPRLTLQRKG
jgi:hypothetical protein